MGGLVGGIFDLLSGDPTQSEEDAFKGLAGFENNRGERDINNANQFYDSILSGDPAKISQVLAPEIKAGSEQVEQQAKTASEFGNRSGGNNAASQAAQSNERGNIINLIGSLQSGAAGAEAGLGSGLLGEGSQSLSKEANLATGNRERQVGDVSGIASDVASIASPFVGGMGGGGGDPYQSIYNAQHTENSDIGLNPESYDSGINV